MKLVRRTEGFLLYDGRTEYFQRARFPIASRCPNILAERSLKTSLKYNELFPMNYDRSCAKNLPEFLPQLNLSCHRLCLKFQVALQSLRSA